MSRVTQVSARTHLESLRLRAVRECGVSPKVADRAVHVTLKALGDGVYDRLLCRRSEKVLLDGRAPSGGP